MDPIGAIVLSVYLFVSWWKQGSGMIFIIFVLFTAHAFFFIRTSLFRYVARLSSCVSKTNQSL